MSGAIEEDVTGCIFRERIALMQGLTGKSIKEGKLDIMDSSEPMTSVNDACDVFDEGSGHWFTVSWTGMDSRIVRRFFGDSIERLATIAGDRRGDKGGLGIARSRRRFGSMQVSLPICCSLRESSQGPEGVMGGVPKVSQKLFSGADVPISEDDRAGMRSERSVGWLGLTLRSITWALEGDRAVAHAWVVSKEQLEEGKRTYKYLILMLEAATRVTEPTLYSPFCIVASSTIDGQSFFG